MLMPVLWWERLASIRSNFIATPLTPIYARDGNRVPDFIKRGPVGVTW